jgi:hypothetical protein
MKKKISFIVLIVAILIVSDAIVGAISRKLIVNAPDVGLNQTNTLQALFHQKADILILGSSRANHSFDSRIITKETGLSCFNAGRDGMEILYDLTVLRCYMKRYVPKIVVLDVNESMIDGSWAGTIKEINSCFGLSPIIDSTLEAHDSWQDRMKLHSNIYRYNKSWEWLLKAYMSTPKECLYGYFPMKEKNNATFHFIRDNKKLVPGKEDLVYLNQLISLCKENGVKIIITYVPTLILNAEGAPSFLRKYCAQQHIRLMDYSENKKYYLHPEYFYDMTHLNEKGAEVFSNDFASNLLR